MVRLISDQLRSAEGNDLIGSSNTNSSIDSSIGFSFDSADTKPLYLEASNADPINLPSSEFVTDATYIQEGLDLHLLLPDGREVIVEGYFAQSTPPDLLADGNITVSPQLVESFLMPLATGQTAQLIDGGIGDPIGNIEFMSGTVVAVRADGTRVELQLGDPVYQGDQIQTNADGSIKMRFVDDTIFTLGENARLALDELVYDSTATSGSSAFSILKGSFVFVSGQIAHDNYDNMAVSTPVATIGIRGTTVTGSVLVGDVAFTFSLLEGAITITSGDEVINLTESFDTAVGQTDDSGIIRIAEVTSSPTVILGTNRAAFEALGDEDIQRLENVIEKEVLDQTGETFEINLKEILSAVEEEADLNSLEEGANEDLPPEDGSGENAEELPTDEDLTEAEIEALADELSELETASREGEEFEEEVTEILSEENPEEEITLLEDDNNNDNLDLNANPEPSSEPSGPLDDTDTNEPTDTSETQTEDVSASEVTNVVDYSSSSSPVSVQISDSVVQTDVITGSSQSDNIGGGGGDDTLDGGGGDDVLDGGTGNDSLLGGEGNDTVGGGVGDDTIIGGTGAGNDFYDGGEGEDLLEYPSVIDPQTVEATLGVGVVGTDSAFGTLVSSYADNSNGDIFSTATDGSSSPTNYIDNDVFTNMTQLSLGSGGDLVYVHNSDHASVMDIDIDGKAGSDSVYYQNIDPVSFSVNGSDTTATEGSYTQTLSNVENITSTSGTLFSDSGLTSVVTFQSSGDVAGTIASTGTFSVFSQNTISTGLENNGQILLVNESGETSLNISQSFVNSGNVQIEAEGSGEGTVAITLDSATLTNNGTLNLSHETIGFKIDSSEGGQLQNSASGVLFLGGEADTAVTTSLLNLGNVTFEGVTSLANSEFNNADGTFTVNGSLDLTNSTLVVSDNSVFNGRTGTIELGSDDTLKVISGDTLTLGSSSSPYNFTGTLNLETGGNLTIADNLNLADNEIVNTTISAGGTLTASDLNYDSYIDSLTNDGNILVEDGSKLHIEGGTLNGTVTVESGGTLYLGSSSDSISVGTDTVFDIQSGAEVYLDANFFDNHADPTFGGQLTYQNTAPNAVADSESTAEDNAVTINVLSNDSDDQNDTLSVSSVGTVINGTATINGDNTITYTPNADFNGTETFTYTVSDGNGGSATETVTVTVSAENDTPTVVEDAGSTTEDNAVTINVLSNDSDIDGDTLSVSSVGTVSNGIAVINNDNTITYTPNANFSGTETFTYTVSDSNGGTATENVTVTINAENDAPDAVNDTATTEEGSSVTIDVLSNDTDVEDDTLTLSGTSNVVNGTVVVNGNNTIDFTPDAEFSGTATFDYTISDGNGGTDTATVTITVNENESVQSLDDDTIDLDSALPDEDGGTITSTNVSTTSTGYTVSAFTSDGEGGIEAGSISVGTGTAGAAFGIDGVSSAGVDPQVGYDIDNEVSEELRIDFDYSVSAATVGISNLFLDAGVAIGEDQGSHEQGHWAAYKNGSLVSEADFVATTGDNQATLNISVSGGFDKLVFTATEYAGGQSGTSNTSDYWITNVDYDWDTVANGGPSYNTTTVTDTLRSNTGDNLIKNDVSVAAAGTLDFSLTNASTLTLEKDLTNAGLIEIATGSLVSGDFSTMNVDGIATNSGTIDVDGGNTFNVGTGTLTNTGVLTTGAYANSSNKVGTFSGDVVNSTGGTITSVADMKFTESLTSSGGNISIGAGSVITVASSFIIASSATVNGSGSLSIGDAAHNIASSQTLTLDTDVTASVAGTLTVEDSGNLLLNGTLQNDGMITAGTASLMTFGNDAHYIAGSYDDNGSVAHHDLDFSQGTIAAAGTVEFRVDDTHSTSDGAVDFIQASTLTGGFHDLIIMDDTGSSTYLGDSDGVAVVGLVSESSGTFNFQLVNATGDGTGTSGNDYFAGSSGNDTANSGSGGTDLFYGYAGNDSFTLSNSSFNSSNVGYLDGGSGGTDTLILDGVGIDFESWQVNRFEILDVSNISGNLQSADITEDFVLGMTESNNTALSGDSAVSSSTQNALIIYGEDRTVVDYSGFVNGGGSREFTYTNAQVSLTNIGVYNGTYSIFETDNAMLYVYDADANVVN